MRALCAARAIVLAPHEQDATVAAFLGVSRGDLYLEGEVALSVEQRSLLEQWLLRRGAGEPLAYLTGMVEFAGLALRVNRSVLIPRPETELLFEIMKRKILERGARGRLWDLCCGSGCLALAFKKHCPNLQVFATDLSSLALEMARENARLNHIDDITFLQGDLLCPMHGQTVDYVVSNPPYVSLQEWRDLERDVKDFEPSLALIGGERGTEFYERLAPSLGHYVVSGGMAAFEIGSQQALQVQRLFECTPWKRGWIEVDWAGHDRFFFLERE